MAELMARTVSKQKATGKRLMRARPDPKKVHGRNERGHAICAREANTKEGFKVCQSEILDPDNGRCHLHGGFREKGVDHHSFVHGRSSKYVMPQELQESYDRFLEGDDYNHLRNEIGLLKLFVQQNIDMMDMNGVDPNMLAFLHKEMSAMEAYMRRDPDFFEAVPEQFMNSFMRVYRKVDAGKNNAILRAEVKDTMESISRLAQTENRRKADEARALTQKDMLQVIMGILGAVVNVCGQAMAIKVGETIGYHIPGQIMSQAALMMNPVIEAVVRENQDQDDEDTEDAQEDKEDDNDGR